MSRFPRIAIVGGGPAGLLLACRLQQVGRAVQVYEADASPDARAQGGMLDLHAATGQAALRSAGLFASFQQLARYEDQGMRLFRDAHIISILFRRRFIRVDIRLCARIEPDGKRNTICLNDFREKR